MSEETESPRETAMYELLKDRIFWTANSKLYDRQGYSLLIDAETAIRDINYRGAVLHDTA